MRKISLLITVIVALVLASVAAASVCPPKVSHSRPPHGKSCGPLYKYNHLTGQCVPIPPSDKPPVVTPPPGTPSTTPPPISATPPLSSSEPREAFCVQTAQRGETFVQANTTSFSPGGDWFKLWQSEATVVLDGHVVTLLFEGGNGVILAAKVPGIGLTCGQPYVTTDGKYADPKYGQR